MDNVANPGSTLGEAVGALIEREVNRLLRPIAEENGCVFVSTGRPNPRTGHLTKLLLKDEAGNQYNLGAVIANRKVQPLVLIESRCAWPEAQNGDMTPEICAAHRNLRRTFPTLRKSIVVLAGHWSDSSKALMRSSDISLFEVAFPKTVNTLAEHGSNLQLEEIPHTLLQEMELELCRLVQTTLASAGPRKRNSQAKEHYYAAS